MKQGIIPCFKHYGKENIPKDGYTVLSVSQLWSSHRSQWGIKEYLESKCKTCETATKQTCGIIGNLNCGSANIIYVYQCLYCDKQRVGETGTEIRVRNNGHRYAINIKCTSSLFAHLKEHFKEYAHLPKPTVDDFDIIPIVSSKI